MIRITAAQFQQMQKRRVRRRLIAPKFAPVAATFDFPFWTLTLPLVVVSEANQREFWAKKHSRKIRQQAEFDTTWKLHFPRTPKTPCSVHLVKLGGNRMDGDNLAGAFKHVRDQIARILGIDDGSDLVTWSYDQQPGGERGIRVEIVEVAS